LLILSLAVAKLLADADLPCFRLACKAFRDHSSPAQKMHRTAFLRTRALVVFAWKEMGACRAYALVRGDAVMVEYLRAAQPDEEYDESEEEDSDDE
jgi:hypothetical protein